MFAPLTLLLSALLLGAPEAAALPNDPPEPLLEPGNELLLVIPDPKPEERTVLVDAQGRVSLGRYGAVEVRGLSVIEARDVIRRHLGRYIVDANAISVVRTAEKRLVFVTGQVRTSGFVAIGPQEGVWEAIQHAGGALDGANLGRVVRIRDGQEEGIDVRAFLSRASTAPLPALRSGDTLFVPADGAVMAGEGTRQVFLSQRALEGKVFVLGAVRSPGLFDRSPGLTVMAAIGMAGGPENEAELSSVRVLTPNRSERVNLVAALAGEVATPVLAEGGGAVVFVPPRRPGEHSGLGRQINVIGGVVRPGRFDVDGAVSLLTALGLAGGPTPQADLETVTLVREDAGLSLVSHFDLEEHFEQGGPLALVRVYPGDTLLVGQNAFQTWETIVRITGDLAIISAAIVVFTGLSQ